MYAVEHHMRLVVWDSCCVRETIDEAVKCLSLLLTSFSEEGGSLRISLHTVASRVGIFF